MSPQGDTPAPRSDRHGDVALSSLVASNSAVAAILELAGVAVAVMNPGADYVGVNGRFAAIDGRSPDQYLGQNHFELHAVSSAFRAMFAAVARGGAPVAVRAREPRLDATPLPGVGRWDWTLSRVHEGRRVFLVLTVMDAAPRLRAQSSGGPVGGARPDLGEGDAEA